MSCLSGSGWWWCNGVGDIFLAHFGPFSTNWASFKTPQSTWVLFLSMSIPLWLQCNHLLMYFQQDNTPCHKDQIISDWVSWTWQWVHFIQMASTVNQISIQQSTFGMWWETRDSHHGCVVSTVWMLSWQYGPTSLRNVSNTLLNLCHEELRQFWRH